MKKTIITSALLAAGMISSQAAITYIDANHSSNTTFDDGSAFAL